MSTNEDFMDYEVDTDYGLEFTPPILQWRRGDLANPNPILKNGGWQASVEHWPALPGQTIEVVHSGGVIVPSHLFEKLSLAVLTYRKQWFITNGDQITWLQPGDYREGAKSRLQVWCLIKEFDNEPALISVKSMNAKYLEEAIKNHVQKIIAPASRQAKKSFARFHFWMPISADDKKDVGHGQYITPPICPLTNYNLDVIKKLFVGSDVAAIAEAEMIQAKEWAETKPEPPAIEPMDYQDTNGYAHSHPEPIEEDEIPF